MAQGLVLLLPNRSVITMDFYFSMNSRKEVIAFVSFFEREKSVFIQYRPVGLSK
jgi:hypothetical protein